MHWLSHSVCRLCLALPCHWNDEGRHRVYKREEQMFLVHEANTFHLSLMFCLQTLRRHSEWSIVTSAFRYLFHLIYFGIQYYSIRGELISLWLYKENNKLRDWKKCIYSTYSPLNSTHLCLRCSNFFNTSKKNYFVCAANRKIGNRKSQRLNSAPTNCVTVCQIQVMIIRFAHCSVQYGFVNFTFICNVLLFMFPQTTLRVLHMWVWSSDVENLNTCTCTLPFQCYFHFCL
jgi:hypothetical protein